MNDKQTLTLTLILMIVMTTITGCIRRPLEVLINERVRVNIYVYWNYDFKKDRPPGKHEEPIDSAGKAYYGGLPNGMTLMLWGRNTGTRVEKAVNEHYTAVDLVPDIYDLVIYSNTEEEYKPYMQPYDRNRFDQITMRLLHDNTRNDVGGRIYYPEPIGVAIDSFEITRDMLVQDTTFLIPYESYMDDTYDRNAVKEYVYEIQEHAIPMTVTLFMKVKVKHRQSLKAIEASLSGLAEGFYMGKINRTTETGTIDLTAKGWKLKKYGDDKDSLGIISNQTATFGLPYGKELLSERDSADNIINFRFTLTNDSVLEYSFKVGKDILYLKPTGEEARVRTRQDLYDLKLELDLKDVIDLPIVDPTGNEAGFDAKVAEWEDGGTFDFGGF